MNAVENYHREFFVITQCVLYKNLICKEDEMGSFGSRQDPQL
jgi:hypothetical protein